MKFVLSVGVVTSATLLLTACGGDGDGGMTNGGTNGTPVATSIAAVSGDAQTGGRTTDLANPLVVVLTDAQGNGVSGVNVTWTKTDASGVISVITASNSQGQASVVYTLGTLPGQSTITASVSGLSGSPVTFTTTAENLGPVTVTVEMSGIQFQAPGGGKIVTVLLGDAIMWVNRDAAISHTATSSSVPAGGATFASALLATGETATFTPGRVGPWVYFCTVHPAAMVGAQIIVQ